MIINYLDISLNFYFIKSNIEYTNYSKNFNK